MAQCAVIASVSGTDVLVPSSADPCTGLVVLTPAEYAAIAASPFALSAEDGLALSVAIVGVWSAAYFWRSVRKSLEANDGFSD